MTKISLKINGMGCDGCAKKIENLLNNNQIKAKVSFKTKTAKISYDEAKTNLQTISQIITDAGYTIVKDN